MGKAGGRGPTAGGGYRAMSVGMMRYRLRTALIVLALGPMVLAGTWFCYPSFHRAIEQWFYEPPSKAELSYELFKRSAGSGQLFWRDKQGNVQSDPPPQSTP